MSKAAELSAAIEQRLEGIKQAAGYNTEVAGVYGFGQNKPDNAPTPCLLVRVAEDVKEKEVGDKWLRAATYQVQGIFKRSATLQEMQRLHHDIIKAIGADTLPLARGVKHGWLMEESAEYDPDTEGSTLRYLVVSITLRYIETY